MKCTHLGALDDRECELERPLHGLDERPRISLIGKDDRDAFASSAYRGKHGLRTFTIGERRFVHHDRQQESECTVTM